MSNWGEFQPEELRKLVEEVNEAERRIIGLTEDQLEPSLLRYNPGKPSVGPLPRYIPTKLRIEEPPIVFGPPERIRPNKRDKLSRAKRQLALVESLIEVEGPSEKLNIDKEKYIKEIREYRKIKHFKRNNKNRNKQC